MIPEVIKDPKRLFTQSQKNAVARVTGATGHADHVIPHSKGGETKIENCQLISPAANAVKSDFEFIQRAWQGQFFKTWQAKPESNNSFLLAAVPGAGKTMAALELARRWKLAGTDRRILVVVPTDNLREQWASEGLLFGLQLQTSEFGSKYKQSESYENGYKIGFQGAVATYSLVSNMVADLRLLCSLAPTMVIFDEIHHCGEDATFGAAVSQSFELASEMLLLSGTPWKSNGQPIPFINYDSDGFAIADYSYGHGDGLKDKVIRHLVFSHSSGEIQNDVTGDKEALNKDTKNTDAAKRLKKLISADGDSGFASEQIFEAHNKLVELRKTTPDAAAMAICVDQFHARKVATLIKRNTGCEPSIIVSDKDINTDKVEAFRKSRKEWLVSVKKVSEGTDIKRLQVLCYLTNTTSELFFKQVVGRVSRVRVENTHEEGYVYLPADPRLISAAENIEQIQIKALAESVESAEGGDSVRGLGEDFDTYTTQMTGTEVVLIGGENVDIAIAKEIERISTIKGLPMSTCYELYKMFGEILPSGNVVDSLVEKAAPVVSLEFIMDDLREKCTKKANQLANRLGVKHSEVHRTILPKFTPQGQMSEQQLREKLARLIDQLESL